MSIIRFILEIENCDHNDFSITSQECVELLAGLEDYLASRGYAIHDQSVEIDE